MKNRKNAPDPTPPSLQAIDGQPETAEELLNRYGTYEIQPTADSDNEFPAIAAGNPEKSRKKRPHNR